MFFCYIAFRFLTKMKKYINERNFLFIKINVHLFNHFVKLNIFICNCLNYEYNNIESI